MTALPALKLDPPALRDDASDVTRGMTDAHRNVYRLLVTHPNGLTRDQLAARSGLDDRKVRAIVEELRVVAALVPHPRMGPLVIGFDPDQRVYTYAKSRAQADAMLDQHAKRIRALAVALDAQAQAARESFGESEADTAVQEVLFDASQALGARRTWRGG